MQKIRIDEPCLVDWNTMNQTKIGRYCGECKKEVIDFSNLRYEELVKKLVELKPKGSVCGHFKEEQLHLDLEQQEVYEGTFSLSQVIFGLSLATLIASSSYSQAEIQRSPLDTVYNNPSQNQPVIQGNFVVEYDHSKEQFTSGTVMSGSALVKNAIIVLLDSNGVELKRILTNEQGEFKMDLVWSLHPKRIRIEKSGYADVHILFSHRESITDMKINIYSKHSGIKGKFEID
jgi:hypothetical protein